MNLRGAARRHGPPYDRLKIWEKDSQITLFCRVNSFFLPQRTPIFSFLIRGTNHVAPPARDTLRHLRIT